MPALSQDIEPTLRGETIAAGVTSSMLVLLPAAICFFRGAVDDPDVWWHLKAAQWILEHRGWPTADSFSQYGAGNPWAAYSWLAELALYGLYQVLGLRGLVLYTAILSGAIVAAFHALLRRLQPNLLFAGVLTLVAVLGLIRLLEPRPWLLSILLFVIELDLLLTANRTGRSGLLLWLVPLFGLWANVHIQFTLGLVVLALAVAEPAAARIVPLQSENGRSRAVPFGWMLLVLVLCVASTLINPYHYRIYQVALQLMGQSALWNKIQELSAMTFRCWTDWIVLAVAVAAAFALGWRRRVRLLVPLLFVLALYSGFRSQRDSWLVLLVGLAVLAYVSPQSAVPRPAMPAGSKWTVAGLVAIGLAGGLGLLSESRLQQRLAGSYPAGAVEFIERQRCAGPMFNWFNWGGYLIFHLPRVPVSIDGRTMVHGEERIVRHAGTLSGGRGWSDDPELVQARLVVLPRDVALTALLKLDPRFSLVYEDAVAAVFVANTGAGALEGAVRRASGSGAVSPQRFTAAPMFSAVVRLTSPPERPSAIASARAQFPESLHWQAKAR